jgi:outer membrane murein-binding lipoprotein Lpp
LQLGNINHYRQDDFMKGKIFLAAVVCTVLLSGGMFTSLSMADDMNFSRAEWNAMSANEQEAKRQELRAKWASMSTEERAARQEAMGSNLEGVNVEEGTAPTGTNTSVK